MRDVVIVGAGPAGSMTARLLADHGHDVVMVEEHETVGRPVHCTGLLGEDAFSEFDLPRHLILGHAEAARFWGTAGRSVPVGSERVRATIIDRGRLDEHLAGEAIRAGAEIRLGTRVERLAVSDVGVTLHVRGLADPIRARSCVLACGANYRFHRDLGLGLPGMFLQSAQIETPFPEMTEVEVRFGREVAPSGFAWLVPVRRDGVPHARIGLMSDTRSRERFATFVAALTSRAGVPADSIAAPRLKMLPLGPVRRTYADRVLAVGDAAGLVKPTTGGGIYYSLLSGALAASTLHAALGADQLGARYLRRYESAWKKRLGQDIRVGLAFRRIAARLNDESIDELIGMARLDGVAPLIEETASFNWHRKAAIALLGHPSFRRIVLRSWAREAGQL